MFFLYVLANVCSVYIPIFSGRSAPGIINYYILLFTPDNICFFSILCTGKFVQVVHSFFCSGALYPEPLLIIFSYAHPLNIFLFLFS